MSAPASVPRRVLAAHFQHTHVLLPLAGGHGPSIVPGPSSVTGALDYAPRRGHQDRTPLPHGARPHRSRRRFDLEVRHRPPARHRDDTASVARATASCATSPAQSHMMSLRSPRSSRPRPPATCTRDSSHRLAADARRVHCCWLCACHWDALDSEPHVTTPRHGVSQARAQIGLHMGPRNGLRRPLMKSDLEPELSS